MQAAAVLFRKRIHNRHQALLPLLDCKSFFGIGVWVRMLVYCVFKNEPRIPALQRKIVAHAKDPSAQVVLSFSVSQVLEE